MVNSLIDLPFALPTIVAGLTLLALYGPRGPTGVNMAFTKAGIVVALLLVTLPFVVRAGAAGAPRARPRDGAGGGVARRRAVHDLPPHHLPQPAAGRDRGLRPGLRARARRVRLAGADHGNIPFDDQVASFYIYSQIESDNADAAPPVSVFLLVLSLAPSDPVGHRALELPPCSIAP